MVPAEASIRVVWWSPWGPLQVSLQGTVMGFPGMVVEALGGVVGLVFLPERQRIEDL